MSRLSHSSGDALRRFAARSPYASEAYKTEIERVAKGWDYLDELFDGLDQRHAAKAKASNDNPALTGQRVQLSLPGIGFDGDLQTPRSVSQSVGPRARKSRPACSV